MKKALIVSVKATARGMVSDMPIVSGLGPREEPIGMDVVMNGVPFPLSDRTNDAGPFWATFSGCGNKIYHVQVLKIASLKNSRIRRNMFIYITK